MREKAREMMMATEELTTEEEETAEEFIEEPIGAPVRTGPYTIAGRVGADLEAQLRRADWHCAKLAEIDALEQALTAPIQEEVERLEARLKAIRAANAHRREFHEGAIRWWVLQEGIRERVGKTVPLAHGQIATHKTQGKTEVAEAIVLTLYQQNPKEYGDLIGPKADPKAVRERYKLRDDGSCVDKISGEVLPEPVIVQTEEPGIKVVVTALGPGRDVAATEE
jgi:hypothetical protein